MSKWHQFDVCKYDFPDYFTNVDLRVQFKETHRWLRDNASGKWKISIIVGGRKSISVRDFLKTKNYDVRIIVSMKKERDVTLFKMFFDYYSSVKKSTPTQHRMAKVLFPIIRRNLPNILANSIIGVQPITSNPFAVRQSYVDQSVGRSLRPKIKGSPSQRRARRKREAKSGMIFADTFTDKKRIFDTILENTRKYLVKNGR